MIITDFTPKCISILLTYLYTTVLDQEWKTIPEEMVGVANKYDISGLNVYFDNKLHFLCTKDNAVNLLRIAIFYKMETATTKILEFMQSDGVKQFVMNLMN